MEDVKKVVVFFQKIFIALRSPTAAALFPAEMLEWPPRSYADRECTILNVGRRCQKVVTLQL